MYCHLSVYWKRLLQSSCFSGGAALSWLWSQASCPCPSRLTLLQQMLQWCFVCGLQSCAPARVSGFKSGRSSQGLTLGVFLRIGEKDPTSAAAEPATVLPAARPPYIPNLHHSQTSALAPIPVVCHIRILTGRGWGVGGVVKGCSKEARPADRRWELHPSSFRSGGDQKVTVRASDQERARAIYGAVALTSHRA